MSLFYVTQLHAGHWYVCPYTSTSAKGIRLPGHLDRAYDTRAEAIKAANEAEASLKTEEPRQ